ncbi:hypothetical protein ACSBR2_027023 [Camellia fascicularis]
MPSQNISDGIVLSQKLFCNAPSCDPPLAVGKSHLSLQKNFCDGIRSISDGILPSQKTEILVVKPSFPTPHHLRRYKLSSRDQFSPQQYILVVFFYINPSHTTRGIGIDGGGDSYDETANVTFEHLKESLSKTLTHFYPLAGRLRDNLSVDCNDEGADYLEARVTNCGVSNILERLDVEEMYQLFTTIPTDVYNSPLLLVQVNFFPCGGMAVCVSTSHKIVDGVAFSAFIKAWSCITRGSHDPAVPDFSAASSRFPPIEDFPVPSIVFPQISQKIVTRRFVFDASKVDALKAKVASASVQQPTHRGCYSTCLEMRSHFI